MSYYVMRHHHAEKPGRVGWVGPIRSPRQADKEVAAWQDAGWQAERHESSEAIRREVRLWERMAKMDDRQLGEEFEDACAEASRSHEAYDNTAAIDAVVDQLHAEIIRRDDAKRAARLAAR